MLSHVPCRPPTPRSGPPGRASASQALLLMLREGPGLAEPALAARMIAAAERDRAERDRAERDRASPPRSADRA